MSAGTPLAQRPPIVGLQPGDRIACVAITAELVRDPGTVRHVIDRVLRARGRRDAPISGVGGGDLVLIAVPVGRGSQVAAMVAERLDPVAP